jgi:hypothetical protein
MAGPYRKREPIPATWRSELLSEAALASATSASPVLDARFAVSAATIQKISIPSLNLLLLRVFLAFYRAKNSGITAAKTAR